MRMMMKVVLDTETSNKVIREGRIGQIMSAAAERMKPEAAYFGPDESGHRCSYFFFDMKDNSQMPMFAEPFFSELNAHVTFTPVMNTEDLQKGLQAIAQKK